jgi:hypothetical protein
MTEIKELLLTPSADRARPEDEDRIHDPLKAQAMAEAMDPGIGKLDTLERSLGHASADTRGGISPTMSNLFKAISNQEVQVQRLGVWAGILFEHPVSDEYILDHPILPLEYTAEGLAKLESTLNEAERSLKQVALERENLVEGKNNDSVLINISSYSSPWSRRWDALEIDKEEREALASEVQAMIDDPNTTIGQLSVKYVELTDRSNKRSELESFISETSSILDDIRDGRASD